jgi:hypothetical protein
MIDYKFPTRTTDARTFTSMRASNTSRSNEAALQNKDGPMGMSCHENPATKQIAGDGVRT